MQGADSKPPVVIQSIFESVGGRFVTPPEDMARALQQCRGVVFDWDGVFNRGRKGTSTQSDFAEADSMGTNMLRYGLWRQAESLPFAAIISGEDNRSAVQFANREHFNGVYTGVKDKRTVIEHLASENKLEPRELICIFDDINDLGMAEMCGVRLLVRRDASPLLTEFAVERNLCDYVTGASEFAVREACELALGLLGVYGDVVASRVAVDEYYDRYFDERQAVSTKSFVTREDSIIRSVS